MLPTDGSEQGYLDGTSCTSPDHWQRGEQPVHGLCERHVASQAAGSPRALTSTPHCSDGWTLYEDLMGTEGSPSCIQYFPSGLPWNAALTACSSLPNSIDPHLLTVAYSGKPTPTGLDLLSVCARLSGGAPAWLGAYHSWSLNNLGQGWSWIDGTSSTNLNCGNGRDACDDWSCSQSGNCEPKCVHHLVCFLS